MGVSVVLIVLKTIVIRNGKKSLSVSYDYVKMDQLKKGYRNYVSSAPLNSATDPSIAFKSFLLALGRNTAR